MSDVYSDSVVDCATVSVLYAADLLTVSIERRPMFFLSGGGGVFFVGGGGGGGGGGSIVSLGHPPCNGSAKLTCRPLRYLKGRTMTQYK